MREKGKDIFFIFEFLMKRGKNKKDDAMHENFRSKHVMHARML